MTSKISIKIRFLLTGVAIGAFVSMVMYPMVSKAQSCGVLGLVTCSDSAGGPASEPNSEPEGRVEGGDNESDTPE